MTLDHDRATEYAEQLARFRFSVPDDVFQQSKTRDIPACYATVIGNEERISVMTREAAIPAILKLNPACAMDLALTIIRLAKQAGWYGDDPISTFSGLQRRAEEELVRARAEQLGSSPLGMNDQRVLESFRRNQDGTWTCIREVRIIAKMGELTMQPGQTFDPKNKMWMAGVNWGEHLEWMWKRPKQLQ
jgi:hypothetical protein